VAHREDSPILAVEGRSFDEFLASRSSNFRQQVRRRERKLRRDYEVDIRLSDAEHLDADLDALFRLHDERWSEGESVALSGPRQSFHRDFARLALDRGWLRLWVLEADGAPRAAWYGFRFANMDWYYQSGRDPEWDRQSVGFVLLAHTIKLAFDDGMHEYRLLRGGEEYKGRFASADPGLETLALPRGLAGRAALGAVSAAGSMPAPMRRRLVKLAG
jgi:CelD/BcsL family acetyltransferase involved in cellulose biosynthesis